MGFKVDRDDGDNRELAYRSEPVDLSGGGLCRRRHRQAAPAGGQALYEHRQVLVKDHGPSARRNERRPVLHGRRHAEPAAAPPPRTARDLSEVAHRLPRKEASPVSALLLRLRSVAARDSRTSKRFAYDSGELWSPVGSNLDSVR